MKPLSRSRSRPWPSRYDLAGAGGGSRGQLQLYAILPVPSSARRECRNCAPYYRFRTPRRRSISRARCHAGRRWLVRSGGRISLADSAGAGVVVLLIRMSFFAGACPDGRRTEPWVEPGGTVVDHDTRVGPRGHGVLGAAERPDRVPLELRRGQPGYGGAKRSRTCRENGIPSLVIRRGVFRTLGLPPGQPTSLPRALREIRRVTTFKQGPQRLSRHGQVLC